MNKLIDTWWPIIYTYNKYVGGYLYDTIEEFNVDSKAECDQLNLAHVARKKYKKKETKTKTNASADLVQYRFKIREGSPEKVFPIQLCINTEQWRKLTRE